MHSNNLYLTHHGIKGQHWGVRRYQNPDGSRTEEGKKREKINAKKATDTRTEEGKKREKINAKKVALGVGVAALATAYMVSPELRNITGNLAKASVDSIKNFANDPKVHEFVKTNGTKAVKGLEKATINAGKAMANAALASIGVIAANKLANKLAAPPNASEAEKNRSKVLTDASRAGINSLTRSASVGGNKNSQTVPLNTNITNELGKPSNNRVDKSSSEWQGLFKDSSGNQRDQETRSNIKSLANSGYDINQIKDYLDKLDRGEIKHSLYIAHHGIKGQKWGVRRYQNPDGTLTDAGKKRLAKYVDSNGNYTDLGIKKHFNNKVEKGVADYINNRKISDPFVRHVVMQNKQMIDDMIEQEKRRVIQSQHMQQLAIEGARQAQQIAIENAQRTQQISIQEANRAASLAISGGMNPFMFG